MKKLFEVEIPWGDDADEGTYTAYVWADDEKDAVRQAADEMADHPLDGFDFDSEAERVAWHKTAQATVVYVACVWSGVALRLEALLSLPEGAGQQLDQQKVLALLQANLAEITKP